MRFHYECPWPDLADAIETLKIYENHKERLDPISLGQTDWLPGVYRQAMEEARAAKSEG